MSLSVKNSYYTILSLRKQGWSDEAIGGYIDRMAKQFSQGEWKPTYDGKDSFSEPKISYYFKGKINLSLTSLRKINKISKELGLQLEFDQKSKLAKISKDRHFKKKIVTIAEGPQRIIVESPKTVFEPSYYGKLLEGIGEVFGIEA